MVDEEAPGVDAFLTGIQCFAVIYVIYFGYYLAVGLWFVSSLQRAPFPGSDTAVEQLPVLEVILGFVVAVLIFATISWLSANRLEIAVDAKGGGPYAAGVTEAFPEHLLPLIFALPPVILFFAGAGAAWERNLSSLKAALQTGFEMAVWYLFTGVLVTAVFVLGVGQFLGTFPFVALSDLRVLILNPVEGIGIGFGLPLVFGTAGTMVGTLISAITSKIRGLM